ncbi:hypothetical protein ACFLYL_04290 [Chloroflexota bacterium]
MAENKRVNIEQQAIEKFKETASRYGLVTFKGHGANNRITIGGNVYYQFGDLRVNTPTRHIIIEAESAGGVTNLVKYWYCLTDENLSKQIEKPIVLLHIFRQVSPRDYHSPLKLWDFLWDEMQKSVGNRMIARRYTYRDISDLKSAIIEFESFL